MSVYPGSLDSFSTKVDKVDRYMAAHMNDVQAAIVAAETELGTNPAGSAADLKTRLAVRIADDGKIKQPQQLVTVGKTNADYTTIQAAIDAISDAADNKRYTVLLFPGIYAEQVTLKDHVDLVGISPYTCRIEYNAYGAVQLLTGTSHIHNLGIYGLIGEEAHAVYIGGGHLYVDNCILTSNGCSANGVSNEAGNATIRNTLIGFAIEGGTMIFQASAGFTHVYNTAFVGDRHGTVGMRVSDGTLLALSCTLYASTGLYADGGSAEIYNSNLQATGAYAIYLAYSTTVKLQNCTLTAAGDNPAIYYYNNSPVLHVYHCKLLKSGSATEVISIRTGAVTGYFAACCMNAPIGAGITNGIATPYNVIDSDVS